MVRTSINPVIEHIPILITALLSATQHIKLFWKKIWKKVGAFISYASPDNKRKNFEGLKLLIKRGGR